MVPLLWSDILINNFEELVLGRASALNPQTAGQLGNSEMKASQLDNYNLKAATRETPQVMASSLENLRP